MTLRPSALHWRLQDRETNTLGPYSFCSLGSSDTFVPFTRLTLKKDVSRVSETSANGLEQPSQWPFEIVQRTRPGLPKIFRLSRSNLNNQNLLIFRNIFTLRQTSNKPCFTQRQQPPSNPNVNMCRRIKFYYKGVSISSEVISFFPSIHLCESQELFGVREHMNCPSNMSSALRTIQNG